jgi:hypothetical protein
MASNKRPKKKYRPKVHTELPINIRFGADAELKLQLIPHQYLQNLRQGQGREEEWHAMAARMNLGNTLAYTYFEDAAQALDDACLALRSVWERFERTDRWGGSGDELVTDEMQLLCTRRELDGAMNHVYEVAAVDKKGKAVPLTRPDSWRS